MFAGELSLILGHQTQTTENSFHGCRKLTAYYTQNQRPPLTEAVFLTRLPRLHHGYQYQTDICRLFSHIQKSWWDREHAKTVQAISTGICSRWMCCAALRLSTA